MYMYSINQEAYILLATIYGGILIAFIYELYKIFRSILKPKKFATTLQDAIFWTIITAVSFYVLIFSNQGDLRFYNFLGFIIGILAYQYILSKPISKALNYILKITKEFLSDLWKLIIYPFQVGGSLIEVPYSYCKKKTKPVYYKSRRVLTMPRRIVYDIKKTVGNYLSKR
ncbi:spore cortex biosynthesis protein YabQ [Alkaliphilus peptidifermentans]|uniref:Spore cortex biosynthesis protein YabQ n=1 Tax=Alkaliphilus peptidifermentans DSM 18978 TaxID=1120976 RepID=A0A1G5AJT0_9FIRM|nr:spore cortex biosynthesis protein YabQ [Alkaliphilus peptidifermentans]SCX78112.1 spore cortex biosynthesis protein YabQ [Alkaliphilus peptidifermentans DSM 18978]